MSSTVSRTTKFDAPQEDADEDHPDGTDSSEEAASDDDDEIVDIRAAFETLFEGGDFHCHGSVCYKKLCPDAPNPVLKIAAIGCLGLPLGPDDTMRLMAVCTQDGRGNCWRLRHNSVQIKNPAWDAFVWARVKEMCEELGAPLDKYKPNLLMSELIVEGVGCSYKPENNEGPFATLMITLPTGFGGGVRHVSHCQRKTTVDVQAQSLYATSVVGWYNVATYKSEPVTLGSRLSILYHLVHTVGPRPSLISSENSLQTLEDIFKSWNARSHNTPSQILYLLTETAYDKNLSQAILVGKDKRIAAFLSSVQSLYKFRIGLSTVDLHVSGSGRHEEHWPTHRRGSSVDNADGVEMDDVFETDLGITNLVSVEGKILARQLSVDYSYGDDTVEGAVPETLMSALEGQEPYKQEFDSYHGNLDRWYRDVVLVI